MKYDFIDSYNMAVGAAIAILTAIFGTYWYLFAAYLGLNILDWLTGWYKAKKLKQESSAIGLKGVVKKTGYWVIIWVGFMLPALFVNLGADMFHIDLSFLTLFGWFTLATLLINEIRSILENLLESGYEVPEFLIDGLALTEKLLNTKTESEKHDQ